jgi:hypothetical protein
MVWVRRNSDGPEHRGSFWFRSDQDAEILQLLNAGVPVELVGWVTGEWRHLATKLVSVDPHTGIAVFEGPGEPTLAADLRRDVAG